MKRLKDLGSAHLEFSFNISHSRRPGSFFYSVAKSTGYISDIDGFEGFFIPMAWRLCYGSYPR
jgi:hypothetical protein